LVDEVAERLQGILRKHGPRSVAFYLGNAAILYPSTVPFAGAFMAAIGSPMFFTAGTIDQPGIQIAGALHGTWRGGATPLETADAILLVGGNPLISKQYFGPNPGRRLTDALRRGAKLIVIDPRRSETARRADVHLQAYPGEDPTVLAGILHLLCTQDLVDRAFVEDHTAGLDALTAATAPFTPDYVARRAGVDASLLRSAAAILAEACKAVVVGGTGMSMGTRGSLSSYLLLCLQSIRGFWAREGDEFSRSRVLLPRVRARAQAAAPSAAWSDEPPIRIRGLKNSVAGLPTGALCEEMLLPGEGQIRALFTTGNPFKAFPDANLTRRALESLELLVTPNIELTDTAWLAHYVVATKMTLETPATTQFVEAVGLAHPGYGWEQPYGSYTPALLEPPAGSDLIEEWQFFYRLAKRMGLQLRIPLETLATNAVASTAAEVAIDMHNEPSSEDMLALVTQGAAVPLDEVRRHPDGQVFDEARETVGPGEPECRDRLDLANPEMLRELAVVASEDGESRRWCSHEYPLLLVPGRLNRSFNSMYRHLPGLAAYPANPVRMNSADIVALGLSPGDLVEVRSRHGRIEAVLGVDDALREGVVALTHGYGVGPKDAPDPIREGANVNALLRVDDEYDAVTGMPRMSAIPVAVKRAESGASIQADRLRSRVPSSDARSRSSPYTTHTYLRAANEYVI
jgi:anaerobic selenocysteine-containing dehydrogenase